MNTGFEVRAALARGDRAYFSGAGGALCLSAEGSLPWRASLEVIARSAWSGPTHELVGRDGRGVELWRMPAEGVTGKPLLALDGAVAQPDFDA